MENIKQDVIKMLKKLPDDCNYDDIMAEIYFKQNVDEGLDDIEKEKVISHEEAKKKLSRWIK